MGLAGWLEIQEESGRSVKEMMKTYKVEAERSFNRKSG